jgi:hypothetical protein
MARQPTVGLDAALKARVVTDVSDKLDDALLTRDGLLNTVTDILNQVWVQPATLDAASPGSLLDTLALAAEVTQPIGSSTDLPLFGNPVTVTNKTPAGQDNPRGHELGRRRPRPLQSCPTSQTPKPGVSHVRLKRGLRLGRVRLVASKGVRPGVG